MDTQATYRRTPIPPHARARNGLKFLFWMGIIFSPFVAFTVNGKVDDTDWTPALLVAGPALTGIIVLTLMQGRNWRALPQELRDEYSKGRLFAPLPAPAAPPELSVAVNKSGSKTLRLSHQGVHFTRAEMLRAGPLKRAMFYSSVELPFHDLAWQEIAEWQVQDDSESPDYYYLVLKDGGYVMLERPLNPAEETAILDYVRSTGQLAVRLFSDVG